MNNLSSIVKTIGVEYPEFNNLIELSVVSNLVDIPVICGNTKYITDGEITFNSNLGIKYMSIRKFKYIAIHDTLGIEPVLRLYVNKNHLDNALTLFEANLDDLLK